MALLGMAAISHDWRKAFALIEVEEHSASPKLVVGMSLPNALINQTIVDTFTDEADLETKLTQVVEKALPK